MNRRAERPVIGACGASGEAIARAFKTLAGVEKDEPMASWVYALYGFLFLVAMVLVIAWLTGAQA